MVVWNIEIGELRGFVGDDGGVLRGEGWKIFGSKVGFDKHDDAVGGIEEVFQPIDVHQDRAGVLGLSCVEDIGKRGDGEVGRGRSGEVSALAGNDGGLVVGDGRGDVARTGKGIISILKDSGMQDPVPK